MFKLKDAIDQWKKSLRKSPYFEDGDIEELETHLRDQIEALVDAGMSEANAFDQAVSMIGSPDAIGEELHLTRSKWYNLLRFLSLDAPLVRNQLLVVSRKLKKNHGFAFINLLGLSVGLGVCFLIYLYIQDELSYDKFHENFQHVYRIENEVKSRESGEFRRDARIPITWAKPLESNYPEIKEAARIVVSGGNVLVNIEEEGYYETDFCYADNEIFSVFTFEFLAGDQVSPLERPNTVVLTESQAKKYFGDQDPIGKRLIEEIVWYGGVEYEVTAVVKDLPANSHFQRTVFFSFPTLAQQIFADINQDWGIPFYYTYLLLDDGVNLAALDDKLNGFIQDHYGEETAARYNPELVALGDIYFHNQADTAIGDISDFTRIIILSAIAVFILAIAIFNYINLSTAQSIDKAKEIGVRKVVGASRLSLIKQYLSESVAFCLIAFVVGILASYFLLPYFNQVAGKQIAMNESWFTSLLPAGLLSVLLVGVIAGLYPAFILSAFKPTVIMRGLSSSGDHTRKLRAWLVGFQFCIAAFLIIATLVVYRQLVFLQQKDLGFNQEKVVDIALVSRDIAEEYATLKQQFNRLGSVVSTTASSQMVGQPYYLNYRFEDLETLGRLVEMARFYVDHDFFKTMDIEILAGSEALNPAFDSDSSGMVVVNEAALRKVGIETPQQAIGHRIRYVRPNGLEHAATIRAVSKDFHLESLHTQIEPMVMEYWQESFTTIYIRLAGLTDGDIASLETAYKEVVPGSPFELSFLDERLNYLYAQETRLGKLFLGFTVIAIVISILGLVGVSAYIIERRTKEVGIRKVLGAEKWQITTMLSQRFLKLVLLSFLLSAPLAYWAMEQWLNKFAYRTTISAGVLVIAALLIVVTALSSVVWQALKAATMNPVKSIRTQ